MRDRDDSLLDGLSAIKDAGQAREALSFGSSAQNVAEPTKDIAPETRAILGLLDEVHRRVLLGAEQYGPRNHHVLGPRGQFADIWRKIGPLKRAMWDGVQLPREGVEEILFDLIGHSLLAIQMYRSGVPGDGEWDARVS